MRAVAIDQFGGPEELVLRELEPPLVGPNDVQVRLHAAGVNPGDARVRVGMLAPYVPHFFPIVLGFEGSGTVEVVGPAVSDLQVGQEVFGHFGRDFVRDGTYAELSTAHARSVAVKPAGLSHELASVLTGGGVTAVDLLDRGIGLQDGEVLLIHGASGAVGSVAVQLAHARGAHVIGTASAASAAYLSELGADETIDYGSEDFADAVRASHPDGIDAVIDLVGGHTHEASAGLLKPGVGRFVSVAQPIMIPAFAERDVTASFFFAQPDRDMLAGLADQVLAGDVAVRISEVLPLAQARQAHEMIEAGSVPGKLVLDLTA